MIDDFYGLIGNKQPLHPKTYFTYKTGIRKRQSWTQNLIRVCPPSQPFPALLASGAFLQPMLQRMAEDKSPEGVQRGINTRHY